jgi:mannose-6-phosphate isomerase-like protein (cupin superfamily)
MRYVRAVELRMLGVRRFLADQDWKTFVLGEEIERQRRSGEPYREFLREPALSCGIYSLPAGATDLQAPHDEDEVYYVVEGCGRVKIGDQEQQVGPGSILYVQASSEHSFFEIEEDVTMLVFFASGGPADTR